MHSCLASLSSLILSFFPWELAPQRLSTAKSVAFTLEHFNKTAVCVRICSLDCSDSSEWIVLSCLHSSSCIEKGYIYIYTYIMHGMNQLWLSQPGLCFLHTWGQGPGCLALQSIPGYLETHLTWISRKEEPHCFGRSCTMSLLWACPRRFLHVGMWRSWYLSESKNKPLLLLIISDSLFRGRIMTSNRAVLLLVVKTRKEGRELLLFWGTR